MGNILIDNYEMTKFINLVAKMSHEDLSLKQSNYVSHFIRNFRESKRNAKSKE